jgi:hypothetical protein
LLFARLPGGFSRLLGDVFAGHGLRVLGETCHAALEFAQSNAEIGLRLGERAPAVFQSWDQDLQPIQQPGQIADGVGDQGLARGDWPIQAAT